MYCQLRELKTLRSTREKSIEAALQSLPVGLDATYRKMVDRIDQRDQKEAAAMLRWLSFTMQPLTLGELQETRLIEFGDGGTVSWDDPGSIEDIPKILGDLIQVDMPFVASSRRYQRVGDMERDWFAYQSYTSYVRQRSRSIGVRSVSPYDVANDDRQLYSKWLEKDGKSFARVRLAHFSVKEYLISTQMRQHTRLELHLEEHSAHRSMAEDCLVYLRSFSERVPDGWSPLEKLKFPLLNYAVNNWTTHVDKHGGDALHHEILLLRNDKAHSDWLRARYGMYNSSPNALYCASELGHQACVEQLLESGQDVDTVGGWNIDETPLQIASRNNHLKIVQVLLNAGANVNWLGERGREARTTALCEAAALGHEEVVATLLAAGADIQPVTQLVGSNFGTAALHIAAAQGHAGVVRQLIDAGSDVNAAGYMAPLEFTANAPPLHLAAANGHEATVRVLINAGADVHATGWLYSDLYADSMSKPDEADAQSTALLVAISNNHTGIVNILIQAGADLEATSLVVCSAGMFEAPGIRNHTFNDPTARRLVAPALHTAAAIGHDELALMLLKAGANVDAIGRSTAGEVFTPLYLASEAGHLSTVSLLLTAGARVCEHPPDQRHPLIAAAENGHNEVIAALVEAGAEVNARSDGVSALGVAAAEGNVQVVESLVRYGAYTDFTDYHGHTALMIAAAEERMNVVQALLDQAGGQPSAIPGFEQAIDLAAKEGHTDIEQMLLDQLMISQL